MIRKNFPSYDYLKDKEIMEFYENFENVNLFQNELCKHCEREKSCCEVSGCMYYVEDFESLKFYYLRNLLEKGNISITSIFDIQKVRQELLIVPYLYLRTRNVDRNIVDLFSLKNRCSLLTKEGCSLSFEERPLGGVMLIPRKNEFGLDCVTLNNANEIALEHWKNHQRVLERLVLHFTNRKTEQVIAYDIVKFLLETDEKQQKKIPLSEEELEMLKPFQLAKIPPNIKSYFR